VQLFDDNGDPCGTCELYAYAAGTTTPQDTYQDSALSVANTNPIVLDAAGRATVYLSRALSYKFVLKDTTGATLWTRDNIALPEIPAAEDVEPVPPGTIVGYGFTTAPTGYLLCDGAAVSRTTYSALYSIIGTTYGVGDGSTTFNVPSLSANVSEWKAYTPTWTGSGSNPAIGNGTLSGRYKQDGQTVFVDIYVVMGSTTTFGTGNYAFALPVTAVDTNGHVLQATLFDAGTALYQRPVALDSATVLAVKDLPGGGSITPTVPFTWAATDQIRISGTYIAATAALKGKAIIKH
jgi:microcystin-dependent protein